MHDQIPQSQIYVPNLFFIVITITFLVFVIHPDYENNVES